MGRSMNEIDWDAWNDSRAQHESIRETMGGLLVSDIKLPSESARILDSGTGDGYWLEDLTTALPTTSKHTLIGTDISDARFPPADKRPQNLALQTQDVTQPWPTAWHNSFDVVNQKLTLGTVGMFPHAQAVQNLAALVKPGGWLQLIEPEQVCGVTDGPAMYDFISMLRWYLCCSGGSANYAARMAGWVEDAGFVDVRECGVPLLLGKAYADEELGQRLARSTAAAAKPLIVVAKSADDRPLSSERLDSLVDRLHEELLEKGGYYPLRVVWGHKPL